MSNETSNLTKKSNDFRDRLLSRNLYNPYDEYTIDNNVNSNKIINSINSIVDNLTPYQTISIDDVSNINYNVNTLSMVGKQLIDNFTGNLNNDYMLNNDLNNVLHGGNLFFKRTSYKITKNNNDNKGLVDLFLEKPTTTYPYPNDNDYIVNNPTTKDYLYNTGEGQLNFLFNSINRNVYKTNEPIFKEVGNNINNTIQPRSNLISNGNRIFYKFDNLLNVNNLYNANMSMINAYNINNDQEYGTTQSFIKNLGVSSKNKHQNNDLDNSNNRFNDDGNIESIVWGVDSNINSDIDKLRGTYNSVSISKFKEKNIDGFGIKGAGLLQYTKNLIDSTGGKFGDITRKVIKEKNGEFGFNGSGVWKANNSKYAKKSGTANETGVRQNNVLDQYDRFAKAIRFNGNDVYKGNVDSVVYKTVIPRIHPTLNDDGGINNKNLMFSIENLAVKVNSDGIVDDEYGSQIPLCEVGASGGRLMWFPPYAMEIQETATAKYESTVMVGRNEPMYNYQNSERSAVLNFTLLVDYPPHVSGLKDNKSIAEFYEFGGDPLTDNVIAFNNLEKKIVELENRLKSLQSEVKKYNDINNVFPTHTIYFPNDVPHIYSNLNTIIDDLYRMEYDISADVLTPVDNTNDGLNNEIYFISGLTAYLDRGVTRYKLNDNINFSQYDTTLINGEYNNICKLNDTLIKFLQNKDNFKNYYIEIIGHCSELWKFNYNTELGMRRAIAAENLIIGKILSLTGSTPEKLGIVITKQSQGKIGATPAGATAEGIPLLDVKKDRRAIITIKRRSEPIIESTINNNNTSQIEELKKQIDTLRSNLNKNKKINNNNVIDRCLYNERTESESAILNGFKSVTENYFLQTFHSQTPEDFHKRLTFLHQCTRQGSAKRFDNVKDNTNVLRARNSVFGRQPICILRIGDFFFTKVIIESVNIDYNETTWDMNPEGFGMQPMFAKVTLNMKVIGGQSLKGPIDALQNAVSYNYYANSTYTKDGRYLLPSAMAELQYSKDYENNDILKEFNRVNKENKDKYKK